ncbi:hypothetical protein [uncultured Flavobacterium sp.]|uniref:hypothetical protein n=1 Tax=uncultured Flavobacterium sp. TaxID=165435 RepID=UPI0025E0638D|nr:hypothetical protein [uncultured Flavobacterium sp.]
MTAHNSNKKENNQSDSIQKFEVTSSHKIDFENIPYLYGMSLEEYKEGLEIHSQCFNQMKKIKQIMN